MARPARHGGRRVDACREVSGRLVGIRAARLHGAFEKAPRRFERLQHLVGPRRLQHDGLVVFERRFQQLRQFRRVEMAQQYADRDGRRLAGARCLQFGSGEGGDLLVDVHGMSFVVLAGGARNA